MDHHCGKYPNTFLPNGCIELAFHNMEIQLCKEAIELYELSTNATTISSDDTKESKNNNINANDDCNMHAQACTSISHMHAKIILKQMMQWSV